MDSNASIKKQGKPKVPVGRVIEDLDSIPPELWKLPFYWPWGPVGSLAPRLSPVS